MEGIDRNTARYFFEINFKTINQNKDMKINEGFVLREMCGEYIIIGIGIENIDFSRVISLNDSAAYLWNSVKDTDFTLEKMVALLMKEYDVDEATALADATALVRQWISVGVVSE